MSLLEVRGLVKDYPLGRGRVIRALRGVDLTLEQGQVLGLVGESGCGKSTLGRCILRLVEPTSGHVVFDGVELTGLSQRRLRPHRRQLQAIFQDPFLSLDPRMTVGAIVEEPLQIHHVGDRQQRRERVRATLAQVGLDDGALQRYPHQFSGGQRQRIGIARALVLDPRLVVADEPVSALDVSVQAQILNLLLKLQAQRGLSLLFISHDLRVVRAIGHRVAVMYLGRVVESGPPEAVAEQALHPYTRALAAAAPASSSSGVETQLPGEVPSPLDPPPGCPFHPRCPVFAARESPACVESVPEQIEVAPGHRVACHDLHEKKWPPPA